MRGRFITLEGGEGAGKSTQIRTVCDWLTAQGREVMQTREPGGTPMAEAIRALVLQDWDEGVDATTEVLLMFAARARHIQALIEPALAAGKDVVCDRFVDSSFAYQGGGKQLPLQRLQQLEDWVLGALKPDLTLILDLPVEIGLARAQARGDVNRFEAESVAYRQRVRDLFLQRATQAPQRYAVLDASQPLEAVRAAVIRTLEDRL